MFNRAARYYPLLRILREREIKATDRVMEVGSGPIGIGEFRKYSFVGCDVQFPHQPREPMVPVRASAVELPFRDRSFPAVIVSDVMEHLPPELRKAAIEEALRVAERIAVFAFPCGPGAQKLDHELYAYYKKRRRPIPIWLQEHMQHPFPDESIFSEVPPTWQRSVVGNESESFHFRMMRMESYRIIGLTLRIASALFPRSCERYLARQDRAPFYRQLFVFERAS